MVTPHDANRSLRARPIFFEIDGRRVAIKPPTLGIAAECLHLEIAIGRGKPETAAEQVVRFAAQARIILGPAHQHLVDELDQRQIAEIVGALYAASTGLDPVAYVLWQQEQRDAGREFTALGVLESIEQLSTTLAAKLRTPHRTVDEMPMADAISLAEQLAQLEKADVEMRALIAGRKLRGS